MFTTIPSTCIHDVAMNVRVERPCWRTGLLMLRSSAPTPAMRHTGRAAEAQHTHTHIQFVLPASCCRGRYRTSNGKQAPHFWMLPWSTLFTKIVVYSWAPAMLPIATPSSLVGWHDIARQHNDDTTNGTIWQLRLPLDVNTPLAPMLGMLAFRWLSRLACAASLAVCSTRTIRSTSRRLRRAPFEGFMRCESRVARGLRSFLFCPPRDALSSRVGIWLSVHAYKLLD